MNFLLLFLIIWESGTKLSQIVKERISLAELIKQKKKKKKTQQNTYTEKIWVTQKYIAVILIFMNWSRGLLFTEEMAPSWLKHRNFVLSEFI